MEGTADASDGESWRRRYRADIQALGIFLVLVGAILAFWFVRDSWLNEYDILTYFLPWYGHLGDRLRAFDIPAWMPWLSAGAPAAGDPSGGWWYAPVMLTFPFLGVAAAFKAMIAIQMLVGGLAVYALSRSLGLRPAAALVSTLAFVLGPFMSGQMMFGTVAGQASTWVPVALLGVERSLHSSRMVPRLAWWGLAGLAISQIAVSWPGQGLYNALLVIAGWVAYRTLLWPVDPSRTLRGRLVDAVTTGPAVLALGLLLGAAGLLPRLHTSSVSNIPNGDYAGVLGGDYLVMPHSLLTLLRDTFLDDSHFRPVALGAPVFVLALLAILVGRARYGIPFFAAIAVLAGILATGETPLHEAMYLLPGFESLHTHSPRRVLWVCFIAPAMLAGAGIEALLSWQARRWSLMLFGIPPLTMVAIAMAIDRQGRWIGWWPLALAGLTAVVAALLAMTSGPDAIVRHGRRIRRLGLAAIVALVVAHPAGRDLLSAEMGADDEIVTPIRPVANVACLDASFSRTDPGGAGEFLQQQQEAGPPFRYVGYAGRDPATDADPSYSFRRCDPDVLAVLVGGRPVRLELESIQGYNPLHLGVYAEYTDVMNGGRQNYHWMDPYPATLGGSPLLDMLNVRYIVVALEGPDGPTDVAALAPGKPEVFRNEEVVVLENPQAFPRAWIVHEVRPNDDGEGLRQLADGSADGRQVAFVDGFLPTVAPATAEEQVDITRQDEDSLVAEVDASAAGVVVFSEIYEEGWQVWVDGESVDVLRVNHALRGVPVPAGEHTIELRYGPTSLRYGLWISTATAILLIGLSILAIRQARTEVAEPPTSNRHWAGRLSAGARAGVTRHAARDEGGKGWIWPRSGSGLR